MTNLKRGDVILVWFPNSDLKTFKRRPALVIQADELKPASRKWWRQWSRATSRVVAIQAGSSFLSGRRRPEAQGCGRIR